jgi:phosphoribosylanthranilate isomerase
METYVIQIRVLATEEAAADDDLRGVIEHVASRRRVSFRDARELTAFLHSEKQRLREEVEA